MAWDLEQEILSLIFEDQRSDSLNAILNRAARAACERPATAFRATCNALSASLAPWPGYQQFGLGIRLGRRCAIGAEPLHGHAGGASRNRNGEHDPRPRLAFPQHRKTHRALHPTGGSFPGHLVPLGPRTWPTLEMLLEVADSSMTYRSRYFTVLQAAPVLDLLMNDEANPRSLAFQITGSYRALPCLSDRPSGAGWPVSNRNVWKKRRESVSRGRPQLCQPGEDGIREPLDQLLAGTGAALPALSDAITHVYFSHAEMERAT